MPTSPKMRQTLLNDVLGPQQPGSKQQWTTAHAHLLDPFEG